MYYSKYKLDLIDVRARSIDGFLGKKNLER